ncbi:MAG: hypothetical protein ACFCUJ_09065 [Thiotrichales bacterium]
MKGCQERHSIFPWALVGPVIVLLGACATPPSPPELPTPATAINDDASAVEGWLLFNAALGMDKETLAPQLTRRHRYWPSCEVREVGTSGRFELCVYGEIADRPAALRVGSEPLYRLRYAFIDERLTHVQGQFASALTPESYIDLRQQLTQQFGEPARSDENATQWHTDTQRAILNRASLTLEYSDRPTGVDQR